MVVLRSAVLLLVAACGGCFDPILPKECPDRVCTPTAQGTGGQTNTKEPPYPCECAGCVSNHDCQTNCQRPQELNACFFPNEGCIVQQGECVQHGGG